MKNFLLIVLDGVGAGELPDAADYGDTGSNTLANIGKAVGGLHLPNLTKAGLGNITDIGGIPPVAKPGFSFGKMAEISRGKDSTTGHWEIGGLEVTFDFPYYPEGFPKEIIDEFKRLTGVEGVLGNKPASGTEIINELGEEHLRTAYPIVYTSADSVFQIAAHEEIIPLPELLRICEVSRNELFRGKHSVGRVIARPFLGTPGNFKRTTNRKDFSLDPPEKTILDYLKDAGINTIAIGKVNDLFNYRGIVQGVKTKSNAEGIEKIISNAQSAENSFIFTNLVDFDVNYGHRNDPAGFAKALKEFDDNLPRILKSLDETDALLLTADHGNDPTTKGTDHSREYVPLLFYRKGKKGRDLGTRKTFSDAGQTVAHFFRVNNALRGTSFLKK